MSPGKDGKRGMDKVLLDLYKRYQLAYRPIREMDIPAMLDAHHYSLWKPT